MNWARMWRQAARAYHDRYLRILSDWAASVARGSLYQQSNNALKEENERLMKALRAALMLAGFYLGVISYLFLSGRVQ